MDFFGQQEKAKSITFWLVTLFILGLIIISTIMTFVLNGAFMLSLNSRHTLPPISFIQILTFVVSITLLVTFFKYLALRSGGKVVAESLGGRLVNEKTTSPNERLLLNVVEEMAIASSLPVPPVYILDNETNINAFAAGFTINDAVIGVTKGTIDLLSRDELQAVIAHEFSHILNGDMRLNLRFTALLFAFLFLTEAGFFFIHLVANTGHSSSRKKEEANIITVIYLISTLLIVVGWISQLWARIMQAAINRQREYLADASSVQFTRHGSALASALKKIGGSYGGATLNAASAKTYNHFFFGQADTSLLATHPSLENRIKRIEPNWDGHYITPELINIEEEVVVEEEQAHTSLSKEQLITSIATASILAKAEPIPYTKPILYDSSSTYLSEQQAIEKLNAVCREPLDACYLIFALLTDTNPTIRTKQLATIKNTKLVIKYRQLLSIVSTEKHLTLIEKAIPALKTLSENQYKNFQQTMMHFINADHVISLFEWFIYQLVSHQVGAQYSSTNLKEPKYTNINQVKEAIQTLLSAIAWLSPNENSAKQAFDLATNTIGIFTLTLQENPTINALTTSLHKLQHSTETIRRNFLLAALKAIKQDQLISPTEAMFLQTLSLCLNCPITLPEVNVNKPL